MNDQLSKDKASPLNLPTVHILMATCQGEAYLDQQLKSIEAQSYPHWQLYVSDDGSRDKTLDTIQAFKARWDKERFKQERFNQDRFNQGLSSPLLSSEADGSKMDGQSRVHLVQGPGRGSTENFMFLVRWIAQSGRVNAHDLVAFADQDDVWLEKKLERAVNWHLQARSHLKESSSQNGEEDLEASLRPVLYAGKSFLVDADLKKIGLSKSPKGPLDFNTALVENVLSGNTMVMNKALLDQLKCMGVGHSVWHDWSAFLVASGCHGVLHYDEEPLVLYRQHEKNVIGVKTGLIAQWVRAVVVFKGRYKTWTQMNLNGLKDIEAHLSHEALELKTVYENLRLEPRFWVRLMNIRYLRVRRQNKFLQMVLYFGLLLKLI